MPRILISDILPKIAVEIFQNAGIDADYNPQLGKNANTLAAVIHRYDGLIVRSTTQVTEQLLARAKAMKIIGRAGIGIDNIDINAASKRGIIVMNTPFGNSVTTAEHAIALMFALARDIARANTSTHAGKWEKSKFMGVELSNKTLGIIGVGNIGSIVANRALGLKMKVIAYDPYLSVRAAQKIGVQRVEWEILLAHSHFISLHIPKTEQTANLIDSKAIAKMKHGVRIINCARGGLVDEIALQAALKTGKVAGAAFDVFAIEPAKSSPLFGLKNVVATPHLGAATIEAQEKVSIQIAEQVSNYLNSGAVSNAINRPSMTADEALHLLPFIKLAEHLGSFIGQLTSEAINDINITYNGNIAKMNTRILGSVVIAGVMEAQNKHVNIVSAPIIAQERGIRLSSTTQDKSGVFDGYIKVTVKTPVLQRTIAGTVFSDNRPRFIQIKKINIDAEIGKHMLYITNTDKPGIIGTLGQIMSEHHVNIANFTLGRKKIGGDAIAILYLDSPLPPATLKALKTSDAFNSVASLQFNV